MGQGQVISARYDHGRRRAAVFKSSVDATALTSTALLSYPEHDLAGDVVVPEGITFFEHMADPRVDIEHRRDPAFGDATAGWAKDASGAYTGRHVLLKCDDGTSRPLPVGTTHFDRSSKLQVQAFALVEREILPDVSLEFVPDWKCAKSLGKSPLEPRDAYEFGRVNVVRWTLCAKGVCPSATTLKSVAQSDAYAPLRSVLSARRIGGEELHPTIFKALSHYLPGKSAAVVSGYTPVGKAMDDQYTPPVDAAPEAAPEADAAPALGGVSALYNHVQALLDACDQLDQDMQSSDSPELRKFGASFCDDIRAKAEKAKGMADKHDAKLNGDKDEGEEGEEDDSADDADLEDDEPDMDTDDEGTLKAVRPVYLPILKACRVKRYSLADIKKSEAKAEQKAPSHAPGDSPEDVAYLEKQLRLFERDRRVYG